MVFPGHIGICSDRRNKDGVPFLIHHGNVVVGAVEKDQMERYEIVGHFRWQPIEQNYIGFCSQDIALGWMKTNWNI